MRVRHVPRRLTSARFAPGPAWVTYNVPPSLREAPTPTHFFEVSCAAPSVRLLRVASSVPFRSGRDDSAEGVSDAVRSSAVPS